MQEYLNKVSKESGVDIFLVKRMCGVVGLDILGVSGCHAPPKPRRVACRKSGINHQQNFLKGDADVYFGKFGSSPPSINPH